jgi:hypothetical protein
MVGGSVSGGSVEGARCSSVSRSVGQSIRCRGCCRGCCRGLPSVGLLPWRLPESVSARRCRGGCRGLLPVGAAVEATRLPLAAAGVAAAGAAAAVVEGR